MSSSSSIAGFCYPYRCRVRARCACCSSIMPWLATAPCHYNHTPNCHQRAATKTTPHRQHRWNGQTQTHTVRTQYCSIRIGHRYNKYRPGPYSIPRKFAHGDPTKLYLRLNDLGALASADIIKAVMPRMPHNRKLIMDIGQSSLMRGQRASREEDHRGIRRVLCCRCVCVSESECRADPSFYGSHNK